MSHALLWNPHFVIRWHWQQKTPALREGSYTSLVELALELGVKDMTEAVKLPLPFAHEEENASTPKHMRHPPKKPTPKATA